jgi:hypothetical protein
MTHSLEMVSYRDPQSAFKALRITGLVIASVLALAVAGCQTSTTDMTGIDKAQGSSEKYQFA